MRAVLLLALLWATRVGQGRCQAREVEKDQKPKGQQPTEIGGRIVISGETVEVRADPDLPPNTSSIATKTDTPLLETPRSVTLIDSQTLTEMAAINVPSRRLP